MKSSAKLLGWLAAVFLLCAAILIVPPLLKKQTPPPTIEQSDKPIRRPHKAYTGKQRIAKLQYSVDQGTSWNDVSEAPNAPIPITEAGVAIGIRAIRSDLTLPWPREDVMNMKPQWDNNGEENVGSEIYVIYPKTAKDNNDMHVVTAECGNTKSIRIMVRPIFKVSITQMRDYSVPPSGPLGVNPTVCTCTVTDDAGKPVAGMDIKFKSDGGSFSGPGPRHDIAKTDLNGNAQLKFMPNKMGEFHIRGIIVGPNGESMETSDNVPILYSSR